MVHIKFRNHANFFCEFNSLVHWKCYFYESFAKKSVRVNFHNFHSVYHNSRAAQHLTIDKGFSRENELCVFLDSAALPAVDKIFSILEKSFFSTQIFFILQDKGNLNGPLETLKIPSFHICNFVDNEFNVNGFFQHYHLPIHHCIKSFIWSFGYTDHFCKTFQIKS